MKLFHISILKSLLDYFTFLPLYQQNGSSSFSFQGQFKKAKIKFFSFLKLFFYFAEN